MSKTLQVDLTPDESVKNSINETISKFTRIDIIINNAGYSQCGTIEELTYKEIRDNFEYNVFGVISVIRNALPHLRINKFFANGPRIINISSITGFIGSFTGFSIYSSTKFALEGLTEEFGIHASTVLLGHFRTSFLKKGSLAVPSHPIKENTAIRKANENKINGNQQGDPVKGCKVIIDHALFENPKTHLFLGPDSMKHAQSKIESIQNDIKLNYVSFGIDPISNECLISPNFKTLTSEGIIPGSNDWENPSQTCKRLTELGIEQIFNGFLISYRFKYLTL
ncbi:hypothetical protein ACTFIZ_011766 [Dictyostelium cf. discoideum]